MNYCNCPNCQTVNCPAAMEVVKLKQEVEKAYKEGWKHACEATGKGLNCWDTSRAKAFLNGEERGE